MSTKTLRKRIALTVVAALATGVLSVTPANAHNTTVSTTATNTSTVGVGTVGASLFVATNLSTSGAAVVAVYPGPNVPAALSLGLLSKDSSSGVAQLATMLAGGTLSFYAPTGATDSAFVASAGTFATVSGTGYAGAITAYAQNQTRNVAIFDVATATVVSQLWTAPTTVGTYTVSLYVGTPTGDSIFTAPTQGTLAGRVTVSVVAASAGGSYSAAFSVCNTSAVSVVPGSTAATANVDSTATVINGGSWYINLALADAYQNALDNGNIVVTATNGGLVNYAEATTAAAGTASTVVSFNNASAFGSVTVTQPTANAPLTTTVTISYNGTTVCTKTVTIRGEVTKIAVSNIAVQDLSGTAGKADFLSDGSGRSGLFTVAATDSAGNQVATSAVGTFASSAASLAGQTIVSSLSVNNSATATSSTASQRYSTGIYTCGAAAGSVNTARLTFTNNASGTTVTSDAFALRCADDASTYTASWDKASYVQGEIATLTIKFLDSKGNPANSIGSTGGWTGSTPMLTAISATGAAASLDKDGAVTYSYSVGGNTAITAGSYVSVIDFTSLTAVAATKQTPSYKVSTGGDSTTNADVLKSIVALIASINKQIQALQKLILKR